MSRLHFPESGRESAESPYLFDPIGLACHMQHTESDSVEQSQTTYHASPSSSGTDHNIAVPADPCRVKLQQIRQLLQVERCRFQYQFEHL